MNSDSFSLELPQRQPSDLAKSSRWALYQKGMDLVHVLGHKDLCQTSVQQDSKVTPLCCGKPLGLRYLAKAALGSTVVYSEAIILPPSWVLDGAEGVVFVLLLVVPAVY